jgi:hypothetical protein
VNYELTDSPTSEAPVTFFIDGDFDSETRTGSFEVQTVGLDENRISGKLQIWLVEDSIDSFQLMPDGSRNDAYVHNHVLRCAVNGTWGTPFNINEGEQFIINFNQVLEEGWMPENMHVVAFVYNDSGVCQVTTCPVVPGPEK